MALEKRRELAEITTQLQTNEIAVKWFDVVTDDGSEIARTPHRGVYQQSMKSQLLADCPEAAAHAAALGW